jgi:hypothetical protein
MTDQLKTLSSPPDPTLPQRYASLIVDALIDAQLVPRERAEDAVRIAAVEIQVRQSMGDR